MREQAEGLTMAWQAIYQGTGVSRGIELPAAPPGDDFRHQPAVPTASESSNHRTACWTR